MLAAAVLVVAGTVGVVLVRSDLGAPDVGGAQRQEVDAFEATLTLEQPDGATQTWAIRANDDDYEVRITSHDGGGRVERGLVTIVGDLTYTVTADGEKVVSSRSPDDGLNPPLADLFQAVAGALAKSDFERSGNEVIAGSPATRYEIELTERSIAAFTDPVPIASPDVTQLTIWIAGEQPRQIEMVTASGFRERLTFLGVGGDTAIAAPMGDFTFDPDPDPKLRLPIELG